MKKLYFQYIFFYYHTLYYGLDINIIIKLLYIYLYQNYSIVCNINMEYNWFIKKIHDFILLS